jgi:aminoglycoside/choline kinase family phosphotransferase
VYAAGVSDDDRDTLLLLEDLTHLRMADQVAGASVAEAEVAIDAAASLHARWWRSAELDQMTWLRPINNPAFKAGEQQYQQVWPLFLQKYGDVVAPGGLPIAERHGSQVGAVYDWMMNNTPLTLAHADYRLDNLLFDDAEDRVVVIDWQLSVRGSGAADVSYLLVQSMTIEARREHGAALVRRWYDGLVSNGVTGYSWDDAFTDFRRGVLLQLPIGVVGTTAMDAANDRGRALQHEMATRNLQALVDYDCAELLLD